MSVGYRTMTVAEAEVFYREADPVDAPVILLLHGFPTAGHMFRDLIPSLSSRYRVIAPDLPGFGNTKSPPRGQFDYTFGNLARVVEGFIAALRLDRYALYIFDYGALIGLRAATQPERVTAIIGQHGNAYLEGLSDAGDLCRPIGASQRSSTGKLAGIHFCPRPFATGNICMALIASAFLRMATRSTSRIWVDRTRTKFSLI